MSWLNVSFDKFVDILALPLLTLPKGTRIARRQEANRSAQKLPKKTGDRYPQLLCYLVDVVSFSPFIQSIDFGLMIIRVYEMMRGHFCPVVQS